jgi:hypothetical protein
MPSIAHMHDQPTDNSLYTEAEIIGLRRTMLLYCRSFPPGYERNQHRRVALSLRRLFRSKAWLDAHTLLSGSGGTRESPTGSANGDRLPE